MSKSKTHSDIAKAQILEVIGEETLKHIEQVTIECALRSGELVALKFRGNFKVMQKAPEVGVDLVTEVDQSSQRIITEIITSAFPQHAVLGEEDISENISNESDFLWAIDPIDGTKNFVSGTNLYAICVSAMYKGIPITGAIWLPWSCKSGYILLHARLGGGAFIAGTDKPLHIQKAENDGVPVRGRISSLPSKFVSRYRVSKALQNRLGDIRIIGSTGYEMCMVAMDSFQYAVSGPAHVWDFAAGIIIVQEAGGKTMTTNTHGKFVEFSGWADMHPNNAMTQKKLRKWIGPIVAGSPNITQFIAENISLAPPTIFKKVKHMLTGKRKTTV